MRSRLVTCLSWDHTCAERAPQLNRKLEAERKGLTVGRGINLTLALIFLVLAILALVVVGNLAALQSKRIIQTSSTHICILFSSEKDGHFQYGGSYMCEGVIWGFAIMAGTYVSFLVVCLARVVVAADIWGSAIVEAVVLGVMVMLTLLLGLFLTTGLATTCSTLRDINNGENDCNQNVPDRSGVEYYPPLNSAQAAVWLGFSLLLILTAIYVIRSFIYLHRLRRPLSPDLQPIVQNHNKFEESSNNPI